MITYTTVDRILAMVSRDIGEGVFEEDDLIEWIGEAMAFLNVFPILEERVIKLNVDNFRAEIPNNIVYILSLHQRAKNSRRVECSKPELIEICDCMGNISLRYDFVKWTRIIEGVEELIPIQNATTTNILEKGCSDKSDSDGAPEYKVIGTTDRELVFSFSNGEVILAYAGLATDEDTGYPLIPDQADFISAVSYYIKWKVAEAMTWRGREGYSNMLQYARQEWLRYAKQAKNWAKMPKTADEWHKSMAIQYNMIPDLYQYFKGFRSLGKVQIWKQR